MKKSMIIAIGSALLFGACAVTGVLDDLSSQADDVLTEAEQAQLDALVEKDAKVVEKAFASSFYSVLEGVGQVVGDPGGDDSDSAPNFGTLADPQTINETVDAIGGGKVALVGTLTQEEKGEDLVLTFDLTSTWSAVKVSLDTGSAIASGEATMAGSLTLPNGEGDELVGSLEFAGTMNVDGLAFPFEVSIALSPEGFLATGSIGGTSYEFDLTSFEPQDDNGGDGDGDDDDDDGSDDDDDGDDDDGDQQTFGPCGDTRNLPLNSVDFTIVGSVAQSLVMQTMTQCSVNSSSTEVYFAFENTDTNDSLEYYGELSEGTLGDIVAQTVAMSEMTEPTAEVSGGFYDDRTITDTKLHIVAFENNEVIGCLLDADIEFSGFVGEAAPGFVPLAPADNATLTPPSSIVFRCDVGINH